MIVLVFFAFLAGIVTVLSPCILPVLPIILASSATGGKRQPFGVMLGFILSFTFFTLFLTLIVKSTGISADSLRTVSVVIILFFGLVLVIPKLHAWFEILASKLSSKVSSGSSTNPEEQSTGFVPGFLIGISLGLVWTPCAGPILAFVVSLALTSTVTAHALFITLAYAIGTSIPMFAIIYGGRKLIEKLPVLYRNLGVVQRVFGVLMILTALAIYFNYDRQFQTFILEKFPNYGGGLTKIEQLDIVQDKLKDLREDMGMDEEKPVDDSNLAPEIIPGGEWFNSKPLTLEELRGNVVLVDFWTYSCINCIRTLPYLRDWYDKYADDGLVIIGVHTPEFEFEKDPENLAEAIDDFELKYPIVQDNNYDTWNAYNNHYWPAKYFIDANGVLRDSHFGEGGNDESEKFIQQLLEEAGTEVDVIVDNPEYEISSRTPETYLGYERMAGFSSNENLSINQKATYSAPESLPDNAFAFVGDWFVNGEKSMPFAGAELELNFESMNVFLVMNPVGDESGEVKVYLDDEEYGLITVDSDRLYDIVQLGEPGKHLLRLKFLDDNVEVYAFTFG